MPGDHHYEIVLRGRIGSHLLGPFVDDFTVEHREASGTPVTRLIGIVRDASHLHGLVVFLASINAELISITPVPVTPAPVTPAPVTPVPVTPVTAVPQPRSNP